MNNYSPKYTTTDSIVRKIKNRLKVENNEDTFGYDSTSAVQNDIDLETLIEYIQEEEDFLEGYLDMIYELPLKNKHTVLKKCVDGLVISALMSDYFNVAGQSETTDPASYGSKLKIESLQFIQSLVNTKGIKVLGLENVGNQTTKKFDYTLRNEIVKSDFQHTTPTNYAFVSGSLYENADTDEYNFNMDCKRSRRGGGF